MSLKKQDIALRRSSMKNLKQSEQYFINGGDLYFIVGDRSFRVHRFFFERDSAYFRKHLKVDQYTSGLDPSEAYVLEDASPMEFESLLWVFYNPLYDIYEADVETLASILRLSHMWEFVRVKEFAVRELEKKSDADITPVERIAWYEKYDVDKNLLEKPLTALVCRAEPLTFEEAKYLNFETFIKITQARERARSKSADGLSPLPARVKKEDVEKLVLDFVISSPLTPHNVNGINSMPNSAYPNASNRSKTTSNGMQNNGVQQSTSAH